MNEDPGELGEHLFERYATDRGYTVLGRHVDLGTSKRPDFLLQTGAGEVVVEVKTFDAPTIPHAARHNGFVKRDLRPVRDRIGSGAKQLRRISARPVVVVLASPLDPFIPLSPMDIMEAMYGDLHVEFNDGPGMGAYLGRNAKLRIEEPEGKPHGDHAHLSAVAVLRTERRYADLEDFILAYVNPQDHANDEPVARLDVFETVSTQAHPLPRTVFNGPLDQRWGETTPGRYGEL